MPVMSWLRYLRFLFRGRLPREVMLDISGVCNAGCRYCPRRVMPESRKGLMSMDTFTVALDEMRRYGIKKVRLYSTGEPTLHPDFDTIMRFLHTVGIHVTVSTNGSHLMRHRDALMLADHVQISISGWEQVSYDWLHHPLRYEKVHHEVCEFYQSIQMLHKRPRVTINMLVTPLSDTDVFRDAWMCFCDEITMHPLLGTTVFEEGVFVSKQFSELNSFYYPSVVDFGAGCGYPFDTLVVSFDGKIGLCCDDYSHVLPLGDIRDGLKTVFNSVYLKGVRHGFLRGVPVVCRGCNRFLKVKQ